MQRETGGGGRQRPGPVAQDCWRAALARKPHAHAPGGRSEDEGRWKRPHTAESSCLCRVCVRVGGCDV